MFRYLSLAVLASIAIAQSPAPAVSARTLVNQYCVGCHNDQLKTGNVSFSTLDFTHVSANAPILEKALRKLRTGEMPPQGLPRPNEQAVTAFTGFLEQELDRAAVANPNPGRPAIHRLNRAEYSNTIRDLLALDIKPGTLLPVDDSGYGFDNIADVLSISPVLLERYMSVARRISRLAVGDPLMKPSEEEFLVQSMSKAPRNERVSDDLPFGSAGGISFEYYFPVDAEYLIASKMAGDNGAKRELRLPITAGLHTVGVTFLRESSKPEIALQGGRRGGGGGGAGAGGGRGQAAPTSMDLRIDGARLKRFEVSSGGRLDKVIISGPFKVTGRGDTPSRQKIFTCRPTNSAEEEPCAHTILSALARRAFRRNVTEPQIKPLMTFYRQGRQESDFDHGIEKALQAMLVSPSFLFRVERDPVAAKGTVTPAVYRVGDFELASRLSFFLWSSIPDDTLLDVAAQNKLHDPVILEQQVRRMLDDPRSNALVANFAGQWLYLRNLQLEKPDPDIFPEFDESLRAAFRTETELFFQNILREDHSVLELLDANYTFLNQRLAEHYGIPNVYGPQFRKVILSDPNRGGLLGQGSVLTVTSYPNRTSVVQRGKWILETLLGAPPPPPPPVPDLVAHDKDGKLLTMRQQMEMHRANPVCASCHARMDPLGFALENYDGVGKWRAEDAGSLINAAGKLPDGSEFVGPAGLKKILLTKHRDEFVATATEKLFLYSLGRGVEYYDMPAIRAISREVAKQDNRMQALITAIVKSAPFQMRRSSEP